MTDCEHRYPRTCGLSQVCGVVYLGPSRAPLPLACKGAPQVSPGVSGALPVHFGCAACIAGVSGAPRCYSVSDVSSVPSTVSGRYGMVSGRPAVDRCGWGAICACCLCIHDSGVAG